ncbi:MAG: sugar transferase [Verrucomicrobia bacterium]|nr:MAG: sugar transferase [Verrucomicrobiota bacterium]
MLRRRRQILTKVNKVVDAALFGAAFWLTHFLRSIDAIDPQNLIQNFEAYAWLLLVIVPLTPPLLEIHGYYQRPVFGSRRQSLLILGKTAAWLTLAIVIVLFFRKSELSRGVVVFYVPVAVALGFLKDELVRTMTAQRHGTQQARRRVILAGGPVDAARLERTLDLGVFGDVEVAARVDLNELSPERLADLLHRHSVNAVIIAPRQTLFGALERTIQLCELEGVEVWLLADFFQTRISHVTVAEIHGHPMLVFSAGHDASWQAIAKGVIDFAGALAMIVALSPVMLAAAIAVRLTSAGPVFFRQQRAGLNGRPFTMLKFRSMVTNAEQLKQELAALNEMSGPVFKVSNDPRVTRVGRFLRKWSIDELPQLFNVLRGEMSLVGPRPLPVDEVERFDDLAHRRRLSVKPGLTCLWQISGRNNVSDFREWVRLDLEYIDNWSLWLDIKILLFTVPAVFSGAGAR